MLGEEGLGCALDFVAEVDVVGLLLSLGGEEETRRIGVRHPTNIEQILRFLSVVPGQDLSRKLLLLDDLTQRT